MPESRLQRTRDLPPEYQFGDAGRVDMVGPHCDPNAIKVGDLVVYGDQRFRAVNVFSGDGTVVTSLMPIDKTVWDDEWGV